MKIDGSNYEMWLIDWLDGNLTSGQVEQLKIYMNETPGLIEDADDLSDVKLISSNITFKDKERLKRTTTELPMSQFEYLSIGSLENDLSPSQKKELAEIIIYDPDKKARHDLIHKIKLVPADFNYKHKNKLIKRTTIQNAVRLLTWGISAAATIALLIMSHFLIQNNKLSNKDNTTQNIVESIEQQPEITVFPDPNNERTPPVLLKRYYEKNNEVKGLSKLNIINSALLAETINDTSVINRVHETIIPGKVQVNTESLLLKVNLHNTLIACNTYESDVVFNTENSKFSRFIAKNFRQRVLKENAPEDNPLKGYEIAEAGVTGLNKLFGWEMALDKNNNEKGEVKSIYFSSRMLKIKTPVKKTEPLP